VPAEDHPGRHSWKKHDAAKPSYLAVQIMLCEALGFKLNLGFESKINSNDATFFHCPTHPYAAALPSTEIHDVLLTSVA
jgi:hypothetical protein